ncbi:hypothetical protein HT031_004575 [Scenedesmus sp. PABB004]|nr:hypothetical protein HT031_004575 [Scenedesmus sp. PABB004]
MTSPRRNAAGAWLLLAAAAALAQEQHGGPRPAAGAGAAACRTGYVSSGISCACAPGWGSHVPGWPNATYPTLPPTCALFRPGKDKLYKAGTVFPPAGAGKGKCFCFACPPGYTSAGGQLSRADAACKAAPTLSLAATYTIQTSGALCDAKVSAAVGAKLLAALKRATKVDAQLAPASCPDSPASSTTPARHQLVLRLSYTGTDAQKQLKQFRTVARKINAPPSKTAGPCAFGVCDAVTKASRGAASATAAAAEVVSSASSSPGGAPPPSPNSSAGCQDTVCESRACQTSACDTSSGVCSYTNLADGTACSDGVVSGQCKAGTCAGLNTNIEAAAQGVTEPVIFKARFAGGASLGKAVTLNGLRNGSDVGEVLGTLYDDGSRLHEDRCAGDGVFSNVILLTFAESDQPVYKAFYVSLLGAADKSLPVSIAAVTTRIDTLLELFPTEQLVTTAQAKVAELVDGGASPEQAIAAIYDLLIEYSAVGGGGRRRAAAAAVPQGDASVNLTAILSRVDASTVTRTTERRVEFKTLEGFPCMVLAPTEYDRSISGGKCSGAAGARRRLQRSHQQQLSAPVGAAAAAAGGSARAGSRGGVGVAAQLELLREAAAASPTASGSGAGGEQEQAEPAPGPAPDYASLARGAVSSWRRLQQAQQCPTSKGEVLVLAPFLLENECSGFGDEAADVAALYKAAGYDVTFKCNDAALCPAGPPALEDFTGWSKYVAVVVSSRGDDDADGNNPVLLTRAPIDLDRYQLDWQAGRIVLSADGHAALRPSWFEKYRNAAGADPARTVVFFASDRSAISPPASARDGVGEKGFAGAFWSMDGAAGYAGFTGYLSRSFDAPSPGVAMAQSLLAGRSVDSYVGTDGKDKLTGAAFRSYPYRRTSTLLDRCAFKCDRVTCSPPQCALSEVICNTLTGSCDISCCNRKDGDSCRLRGRPSTCSGGKCVDNCASALCSAPPCQALVGEQGAICDPLTGRCPTTNLPDGTSCSFQGGRGSCVAGACKGLLRLFYRLRGPADSFPDALDSPALSAFAAGVHRSLDLPPSYPTSSISVSVLQPLLARAARGLRAAPAADTTARLTAELLDDPPLPQSMNFRVLGSAAKLQLGDPFGPGLTVERTDESGNVLVASRDDAGAVTLGAARRACGAAARPARRAAEPPARRAAADLCAYKECPAKTACTTPSCVRSTGACSYAPANDGAACSAAGGVGGASTNGTCSVGVCVLPDDPCATSPCSQVANAVPGTCVRTGDNTTLAASFRCSCAAGFSWVNDTCTDVDGCRGNPCATIPGALADSCQDLPAPQTGFACRCNATLAWQAANATCVDARSCRSNPCANFTGTVPGSCVERPGTQAGFACNCTAGLAWAANATSTACVDADGCRGNPCATIPGALADSCEDLPAPQTGFACRCNASLAWQAASATCVDRCANVTCASTECKRGSCNATTGACASASINENGACTPPQGARRSGGRPAAIGGQGVCRAGVCTDLCANVVCAAVDCRTGACSPTNGSCTYADLAYGTPCSLAGQAGSCAFGSCVPFPPPGPCAGVTCDVPTSVCRIPGGTCSSGTCSFTSRPTGSGCGAGDGSYGTCTAGGACQATVIDRVCITSPAAYTPHAVAVGASGAVYFTTRDNKVGRVLSIAPSGTPGVASAAVQILYDAMLSNLSTPDYSLPGLAVDEAAGRAYVVHRSESAPRGAARRPGRRARPRRGSRLRGAAAARPLARPPPPAAGSHCVLAVNTSGADPAAADVLLGACDPSSPCSPGASPAVCLGSDNFTAPASVRLYAPSAVALGPPGGGAAVLYISDTGLGCVRELDLARGVRTIYGECDVTVGVAPVAGSDPAPGAAFSWWVATGTGALEYFTGPAGATTGNNATELPPRRRLSVRRALDPVLTRVGGLAVANGTLWVADGDNDDGAPASTVPGQFTLLRLDALPAVPAYFAPGLVFAGARHTCGVPARGALAAPPLPPVCWGAGGAAVLTPPSPGDNSTGQLAVPSALQGNSRLMVLGACAGRFHSCVLSSAFGAKRLDCWGCEPGNALCAYVAANPSLAATASPQLLCGPGHLCLFSTAGTLTCFDGSAAGCGAKCAQPGGVSWPGGAARGAAGPRHTCAVDAGGTLRCWPPAEPAAGPLPAVAASAAAVQVCAGDDFTCATFDAGVQPLQASAVLRCWPPGVLALPPGLERWQANVTSITCGARHVCASKGNGQTVCIGAGDGCAAGACNVPTADRAKWPFRPDVYP